MEKNRRKGESGDFLTYCSFCGLSREDLGVHLIVGPQVSICDECVDVCMYALIDVGKRGCFENGEGI